MPYQFSDASDSPFAPGALFLGRDPHTAQEIGIRTERHAITIAGARSGKGAALLIPNLLRWPDSALVVDPKGENAENTWQAREAMGQRVGVVDPFRVADIPDHLRASFNPLAAIDPTSRTARADVEVIADGLVKRSDPKHAEWDDGAVSILAGVIAFVISDAPPEDRNLTAVRRVLLQSRDELYADAQIMADCDACGGLAKSAGVSIMTALESEKGLEKDFLASARRHSKWIDDPVFAETLSSSTFDLADLKAGHATLYLVLPPEYLDTQGVFLRLFVRCAINAMAKGGRTGGRCLFLLDEFYSLGRLDIVAKSAGLMPGYGVHLWPFLQDLGQLQDLYNDKGAQTFFGSADAHVFFGNADSLTLEYVSERLGRITAADIGVMPPTQTTLSISPDLRAAALTPVLQPRPTPTIPHQKLGGMVSAVGMGVDALRNLGYSERMTIQARARQALEEGQQRHAAADANAMRDYQHAMSAKGDPRLPPAEVKTLVGKPEGQPVALSMIVFTGWGPVFNLALAPYFQPSPQPTLTRATSTNSIPPEIRVARDNYYRALEMTAQLEKARNWQYGVLWIIVGIGAVISGILPYFIGKTADSYVLTSLIVFAGLIVGVWFQSDKTRKDFERKKAPLDRIIIERGQQMMDHMSRHGLKEIPLDN